MGTGAQTPNGIMIETLIGCNASIHINMDELVIIRWRKNYKCFKLLMEYCCLTIVARLCQLSLPDWWTLFQKWAGVVVPKARNLHLVGVNPFWDYKRSYFLLLFIFLIHSLLAAFSDSGIQKILQRISLIQEESSFVSWVYRVNLCNKLDPHFFYFIFAVCSTSVLCVLLQTLTLEYK